MAMAAVMTETDVMYDVFLHLGERRRKRICAYYVCPYCDNQYLFGIPKSERACPVCMSNMHLVSTVDEFEAGRMDSWSGGNILHKEDLTEETVLLRRVAFFMSPDIGQQVKDQVRDNFRKELC